MVKASSINATIIDNHVFDQSIVGIFPKDESNLYYLLALMNSDIVNELIHVINPTANNSANYVKMIPYIEPSRKDKAKIIAMVSDVLESLSKQDYDKAMIIENAINQMMALSNIWRNHFATPLYNKAHSHK